MITLAFDSDKQLAGLAITKNSYYTHEEQTSPVNNQLTLLGYVAEPR